MWKCECGDTPYADDNPGQYLFNKLEGLKPFNGDGAMKGSMDAQMAEDSAKLAMQKADQLKRKAKGACEDNAHKQHDKVYWEPGHETAMSPGFLELGFSRRSKKCGTTNP